MNPIKKKAQPPTEIKTCDVAISEIPLTNLVGRSSNHIEPLVLADSSATTVLETCDTFLKIMQG